MENETPSWMVFLLLFFGITAATAFGFFIYYHAQAASLYEEWQLKHATREQLERRKEELDTVLNSFDEPIVLRQEKIQDIDATNDQEELSIRQFLLPNHKQAIAEGKESIKDRIDNYREQLKDADTARADLLREQTNTLDSERQAADERARLREQVQDQSQQLEQIKKAHRADLLVLDRKVQQREERVQELLDRIDTASRELRSDGVILRADASAGYVVIDRGLEDNLRRGTRFQVFNRRGGRNYVKGEVEVLRLRPRIAVCRVLSEHDANDPLIPGDHVHNLIYNPDEVKIFVIAGTFDTYNAVELGRMIRDAGGRVEEALSTRTHYLVAGEEAAAEIKEAGLLGVTILSEGQLLDFVTSPFRFRVQQGMTFALAGTFDQIPRSRVRDYVRSAGGVIEKEIADGLHVLIAGAGSDEAQARARALGAIVITQDQLVHLVAAADRSPR